MPTNLRCKEELQILYDWQHTMNGYETYTVYYVNHPNYFYMCSLYSL